MPEGNPQERRRHERYPIEIPSFYAVTYDFHSSVTFQIKKEEDPEYSRALFQGESSNVSAQGLCLRTVQELCRTDALSLILKKPNGQEKIVLEGRVRWCRALSSEPDPGGVFESGLAVLRVDGQETEKTVVFDECYGLYWSCLLQSIFGPLEDFARGNKKND